jgi:Mrp family chromosome partitioning ATPase
VFYSPYFSSSSFFYINNSIQNTGDISKLTQIPLIGVVGLNKEISELAVLTDLSRLCQSLRAIRSSLQYLYNRKMDGAKTMVTSSVSGEGKHFVA